MWFAVACVSAAIVALLVAADMRHRRPWPLAARRRFRRQLRRVRHPADMPP